MKGTILILDYGTSALKVILYNDNFQIVSKRSAEMNYLYPATHRMEFAAGEYGKMALKLMKEMIDETGSADTLEVVSVTGQAETLISIDEQGEPLGNAIVWLDTRAKEECEYLREKIGADKLYDVTGLTDFDPVMPLCKLLWIKKKEPERYRNTYKFLLLKDYIISFLTGKIATDYSVSSCSGYLNIRTKAWQQEFLDIAEIVRDKLPEPMSAQTVLGRLLPKICREIGCNRSVLAVNGMLDQCASAIGSGNVREGLITETTGSVLAVAATMPEFSPELFTDKMPVMCHGISDKYLALPNCPTGGILLKWYKDNFFESEDRECGKCNRDIYKYMDECIENNAKEKNSLFFLPHFCGYLSPVSNPDARGVIYGLTMDTNRYDIARSLLEGVAFLLRENIELLKKNGITASELISLGGGARSPLWLQIKADTTHMAIQTLADEESTALGCAMGAAIAVKKLADEKKLEGYIRQHKKYCPNTQNYGYIDSKFTRYLELNMQLGFTM